MEFYTENGYSGSNYNPSLSTKEIGKLIRTFVKQFKGYKFSVKTSYNTITINLHQGPTYPFETENTDRLNCRFYNDNLTDEYRNIVSKVREFVESYHYNDSDSRMDYFDTNFYFFFNVGDFEKPFTVK